MRVSDQCERNWLPRINVETTTFTKKSTLIDSQQWSYKILLHMRSIFWFRRDLRLHDNTALYHALSSGTPVVPIFIFDTDLLEHLEDRDDSRVTFIHKRLSQIATELESFGSTLRVFIGKPSDVFAALLAESDLGAVPAVYANHDYEPYAVSRDLEVQRLCLSRGVCFETFKDQVVFEKLEVSKSDGKPYTVFTPYKNKWKDSLSLIKKFPSEKLSAHFFKSKPAILPSLKEVGFVRSSIEVPEPNIGPAQLRKYADTRDTPSVRGTSRIGVHLRFGTVSVRECVQLALDHSDTWLDEDLNLAKLPSRPTALASNLIRIHRMNLILLRCHSGESSAYRLTTGYSG